MSEEQYFTNLQNDSTISPTPANITPNSSIPAQPSVDNLYPAIVQCFAIIFSGYIAGRAEWITPTQGKGIGTFVGKFCLPALLFRSMVVLDFSSVNWYFLLGIAISKTVVFVSVVVLTLLVKRPMNLGHAGLFGMFATQSNDFALGYPILKALYSETNPEYLQYIYLIAPISLIFLNPIGFTLVEIYRRNQDKEAKSSKLMLFVHVVKGVLANPIVFMSFVGLLGNLLFKQKVPGVVDNILVVLGNAFSASALFYLGVSLVGKVQGQFGSSLIVPLLLIAAKTLLLPLITWQVVEALVENHAGDSKSLSMYGFLYGTFPTAPTVFLYASQYSVGQDVIATGLVVCTFLSAPLMFVSAKMLTVVVDNEMNYKSLLLNTSFDFSVISLVCNIWMLGLLFFSRKHKKMPHHFLVLLILAQSLMCVGMIIYDGLDAHVLWKHYLQFVMLLVGVFSSRCIVAVLSIVLYLLHCRSLCYVLRVKVWFYFLGIGFPLFCVGLLLVFGNHHIANDIDPSFHYGEDQAIMSLVVLGVSSVINITSLVLRQRSSRIAAKRDIKVKRRPRSQGLGVSAGAGINMEEDDEEEGLNEKLLPDHEKPVADPPRRTRTTSQSKLLSKADRSHGRRKYRSISCSSCTEDCDAAGMKPTPATASRQNSTSIEDIIPFPPEMQRPHPPKHGRKLINHGSINNGPDDDSGGGGFTTNDCSGGGCGGSGGYSKDNLHCNNCSGSCGGNDHQQQQEQRSNHGGGDCGVSNHGGGDCGVSNHGGGDGGVIGVGRGTNSPFSSSSDESFGDSVRERTCESGMCDYQQKRRCAGLLRCYAATNNAQVNMVEEGNIQITQPKSSVQDEYQTDKFIALLLILQLSTFIGMFLCTWRLFNKGTSGIYIEIEFLDSFFNYAQSLVVFAIFGFDTRLVILPCIRRWRKCLYGVETLHIPDKSQLSGEEKHTCEQFIKYHLDNCSEDIVRDMKYRFRTYTKVFCGSSLCDWLVEVGLCKDRSEAVKYGRTLMRGQVISHVASEHNFHDMPYFYRFMDQEDDEEEEEGIE